MGHPVVHPYILSLPYALSQQSRSLSPKNQTEVIIVLLPDIGEVIRTRHQQRRRTLSAGKKDADAMKAVTVSGLLATHDALFFQ